MDLQELDRSLLFPDRLGKGAYVTRSTPCNFKYMHVQFLNMPLWQQMIIDNKLNFNISPKLNFLQKQNKINKS